MSPGITPDLHPQARDTLESFALLNIRRQSAFIRTMSGAPRTVNRAWTFGCFALAVAIAAQGCASPCSNASGPGAIYRFVQVGGFLDYCGGGVERCYVFGDGSGRVDFQIIHFSGTIPDTDLARLLGPIGLVDKVRSETRSAPGGLVRLMNRPILEYYTLQKTPQTCYAAALETAVRYGQAAHSQDEFVNAMSSACRFPPDHPASFVQILFALQQVMTGHGEWYDELRMRSQTHTLPAPPAAMLEDLWRGHDFTPCKDSSTLDLDLGVRWAPPDQPADWGGAYPISSVDSMVGWFSTGAAVLAGLTRDQDHVVVVVGMNYRLSGDFLLSEKGSVECMTHGEPKLESVLYMDSSSGRADPVVMSGASFLESLRFALAVVTNLSLIPSGAVTATVLAPVAVPDPLAAVARRP